MTDTQHDNPDEKEPSIEVSGNSPYIAHNITHLRNSKGVHIRTTWLKKDMDGYSRTLMQELARVLVIHPQTR